MKLLKSFKVVILQLMAFRFRKLVRYVQGEDTAQLLLLLMMIFWICKEFQELFFFFFNVALNVIAR